MSEPTAEDVRRRFSWTDPTVYEWTLGNSKRDVSEFVGFLIGAMLVFPGIVYGVLWGLSWMWATGAFWLAAAAFAITLVAWVVLFVGSWVGPRESLARDDSELWLPVFGIGLLVFLMMGRESPVLASFSGPTDELLPWAAYFFDNVVSVLLLDIPEIYDLATSEIAHDGWLSKLATVLFRLLVTAGLLEFALTYYRTRYLEQRTYATVAEFYAVCKALPDEEDMVYTMKGRVTPLDPVEGGVEAFLEAFEAEHEAADA